VADVKGFDAERANPELLSGFHRAELDLTGRLPPPQLGADESLSQGGGVDGGVDLFHEVPQRANVVFVTMGDDDRPDCLELIAQVGPVRDDKVHPQHVALREHDAGINDDGVAPVLEHQHVLADLPQSPQGDDA